MNVIGQTVLVGTITRATAWDEDGNPTETETLPGWHANIARNNMTEALAAYEVTPGPNTPVNTWSGDVRGEDGRWRDTVFLKFTGEAEGMAALEAAGFILDSAGS